MMIGFLSNVIFINQKRKVISLNKVFLIAYLATFYLSACDSSHPIGWECQEIKLDYGDTGRIAEKYTECRQGVGSKWLKSGKDETFDSDTGDLKNVDNYKIHGSLSSLDGLSQHFKYSNGKQWLFQETNYVEGKQDGFYRAWTSNGQLIHETKYKMGKREDEEKTWDKNGHLIKSDTFNNNGGFSSRKRWSGQLIESVSLFPGYATGYSIRVKRWYENGKMAAEIFLKNIYENNNSDVDHCDIYDPNGNATRMNFSDNPNLKSYPSCMNYDDGNWTG